MLEQKRNDHPRHGLHDSKTQDTCDKLHVERGSEEKDSVFQGWIECGYRKVAAYLYHIAKWLKY